MNELIEGLWNVHSVEYNEMNFDGFKQAIQTACKAQRNACAREWINTHFDYEIGCNILTAKIERCDYE